MQFVGALSYSNTINSIFNVIHLFFLNEQTQCRQGVVREGPQAKKVNPNRNSNVTSFVTYLTAVTLSRQAQNACVPNIKHI